MTNKQKLSAFKIILIGDCRVGKTSILNKLILKQQRNPGGRKSANPPTIGVEYAVENLCLPNSNRQLRTQIWDTSGAEKYQAITSTYYRKSQGAILIFDLTQRDSFKNVAKWLNAVKQNSDKTIAISLVANKLDLVESGEKARAVTEDQILKFCLENHLTYKQTSAVTGYNVGVVFSDMLEKIYEAVSSNPDDYHEYSDVIKASFTSDQTVKKKDTFTLELEPIHQEQESKCFKCC